MSELVSVEWVTTQTFHKTLLREDYEAIKDDLEDGLAVFEPDAELEVCTREIVEVCEDA